jgi:hypothetical protein
MPKTCLRKPDGRKSKALADAAIAQDDQSTLPPKKTTCAEREAPSMGTLIARFGGDVLMPDVRHLIRAPKCRFATYGLAMAG